MVDINEISKLINLKLEGSYWDFKRQWYSNNKKEDLLHDIICMANNLTDKDGLIIIGVDEEKDYQIVGVNDDCNRRNTQKITDFLKDKDFAGDIRPTVYVETFKLSDKDVDVIVVKSDNNTPYYLKVDYKGLKANHIYTRVQDTNTAKNSSADINNVEKLWKKRFGLSLTPLEKVGNFLQNTEGWAVGPAYEMYMYYKLHPEYTINCHDAMDDRDGYEFYLFSQIDSSPHWYDIKIKYHQTTLVNVGGASLDGGRYFTPCPLYDTIKIYNTKQSLSFRYMEKDSLIYKLNEFYYYINLNEEATMARESFFEVILLFQNSHERLKFKEYVNLNRDKIEIYKNSIDFRKLPKIEGYVEGAFQKKYDDALILNKMLEEFRDEKTINTYKEEIWWIS